MHIAQYVSGFLSVLLFVVKAHFVKQMKVQVCLEMCGGPCNGDLSAQLGPPVSQNRTSWSQIASFTFLWDQVFLWIVLVEG